MPGETTHTPAAGLESSGAVKSVTADVTWSGLGLGPACSKLWKLHALNFIGK